uniref:Uncharacterized protein n=1 Tax=Arundo donax TaxID=35708 RepID=A0A0A9FM60_ARUDO
MNQYHKDHTTGQLLHNVASAVNFF